MSRRGRVARLGDWKTPKHLCGCHQLAPDPGDGSAVPWARFWFE